MFFGNFGTRPTPLARDQLNSLTFDHSLVLVRSSPRSQWPPISKAKLPKTKGSELEPGQRRGSPQDLAKRAEKPMETARSPAEIREFMDSARGLNVHRRTDLSLACARAGIKCWGLSCEPTSRLRSFLSFDGAPSFRRGGPSAPT